MVYVLRQWDASPFALTFIVVIAFHMLTQLTVCCQHAPSCPSQFGRKWTLVPGTLISASAVAMCPLATSYEQLALCVTAWGIGNSILGSTPTAFMADVTDLEKRSQAFALLRTGGDLGLMVGAGILCISDHFGLGVNLGCFSILDRRCMHIYAPRHAPEYINRLVP